MTNRQTGRRKEMSWEAADFYYDHQAADWNDKAHELANKQLANYDQDNKDEVRRILSRAYFIVQRNESLSYDTEGALRTLELVSELHPTKNSPEAYLAAVEELCDLAIEGVTPNV